MSRLLLLAPLLAFLVFLPAVQNGFAQDDVPLVMVAPGNEAGANPMVFALQPLGDYFAVHYWHGAGAASWLYRPVTILSFALTRHLLGPTLGDAPAHHLVNVLGHALATGLVGLLLLRLRAGPRAALAGALVFGMGAIKCEVVASIVGRSELLGFALGAGGTLLALRAADARRRGSRLALGMVAACAFFLAFAGKESALGWLVLAPLVALACAWRDRVPARRPTLVALGCAAPAALVFLALRARALAGLEAVPPLLHTLNPLFEVDTMTRIVTGTVVWAYGLLKTLAPYPLVSDYGGPTFTLRASALDSWFLLAFALLLALAIGTVRAARRWPLLGLAGAAFFVFSGPTSNLAAPFGTVFAERLWYAPSLALACAAAWLVERRVAPRAVAAVLAAWLVANAALALARIPAWRDDATLILTDVATNPRAPRLQSSAAETHYRLSEAARRAGPTEPQRRHLERAIEHQQQAVTLDPEYGAAWQNLGFFLLARAGPEDARAAEAALRRGLGARHLLAPESLLLHLNLARALVLQGRRPEAVAIWRELLARPDLEPATRAGIERELK